MRGKVALFVLSIMSSSPAIALTQEQPGTGKNGIETDSTPPKTPAEVTNPVLVREQGAYKEWAKAMRESSEAAARVKGRKSAEREASRAKTAKAKEERVAKKAKLSIGQLHALAMRGLLAGWPTDSPADLAAAQAVLEPIILRKEEDKWLTDHVRPPPVRPGSSSEAQMLLSSRSVSFEMERIRKSGKIPVAACDAKKADGGTCGRKTVGDMGAKCYEHRK